MPQQLCYACLVVCSEGSFECFVQGRLVGTRAGKDIDTISLSQTGRLLQDSAPASQGSVGLGSRFLLLIEGFDYIDFGTKTKEGLNQARSCGGIANDGGQGLIQLILGEVGGVVGFVLVFGAFEDTLEHILAFRRLGSALEQDVSRLCMVVVAGNDGRLGWGGQDGLALAKWCHTRRPDKLIQANSSLHGSNWNTRQYLMTTEDRRASTCKVVKDTGW